MKSFFQLQQQFSSSFPKSNTATNSALEHKLISNLEVDKIYGEQGTLESIYALKYNPFGDKLATTREEFQISIVDCESKAEKILKGHKEIVSNLVWFNRDRGADTLESNNYDLISSSLDKTIRFWNLQQPTKPLILRDHNDWIRVLSLSKDNLFLMSGDVSSNIYYWDVQHLKPVIIINSDFQNFNDSARLNSSPTDAVSAANFMNTVNGLQFGKNGQNHLVGCGNRDGFARIYDTRCLQYTDAKTKRAKPIFEFCAHEKANKQRAKLNEISFSNNDVHFYSSGRDSTIRCFDLRCLSSESIPSVEQVRSKGAIVKEFNQHKCNSYNVNMKLWQNEKYIVSGSEDKCIYIYENKDQGKLLRKLQKHSSSVHLVECLDDHWDIVSGSIESNQVFRWKPILDKEVKELKEKEFKNQKDVTEQEDPSIQMHRKMVEELMEKYGDSILNLFHQNNFDFTTGIDSLLMNIGTELLLDSARRSINQQGATSPSSTTTTQQPRIQPVFTRQEPSARNTESRNTQRSNAATQIPLNFLLAMMQPPPQQLDPMQQLTRSMAKEFVNIAENVMGTEENSEGNQSEQFSEMDLLQALLLNPIEEEEEEDAEEEEEVEDE